MEKITRKKAERLIGICGGLVFGGYYCSKYRYMELCNLYGIECRLHEVGYNHGLYGWNWTLYHDMVNDIMIIDSYRNRPSVVYMDEYELNRLLEFLRG